MSSRDVTIYECDYCARQQVEPQRTAMTGMKGPSGWLHVAALDWTLSEIFCSAKCLLGWADRVDAQSGAVDA